MLHPLAKVQGGKGGAVSRAMNWQPPTFFLCFFAEVQILHETPLFFRFLGKSLRLGNVVMSRIYRSIHVHAWCWESLSPNTRLRRSRSLAPWIWRTLSDLRAKEKSSDRALTGLRRSAKSLCFVCQASSGILREEFQLEASANLFVSNVKRAVRSRDLRSDLFVHVDLIFAHLISFLCTLHNVISPLFSPFPTFSHFLFFFVIFSHFFSLS